MRDSFTYLLSTSNPNERLANPGLFFFCTIYTWMVNTTSLLDQLAIKRKLKMHWVKEMITLGITLSWTDLASDFFSSQLHFYYGSFFRAQRLCKGNCKNQRPFNFNTRELEAFHQWLLVLPILLPLPFPKAKNRTRPLTLPQSKFSFRSTTTKKFKQRF